MNSYIGGKLRAIEVSVWLFIVSLQLLIFPLIVIVDRDCLLLIVGG